MDSLFIQSWKPRQFVYFLCLDITNHSVRIFPFWLNFKNIRVRLKGGNHMCCSLNWYSLYHILRAVKSDDNSLCLSLAFVFSTVYLLFLRISYQFVHSSLCHRCYCRIIMICVLLYWLPFWQNEAHSRSNLWGGVGRYPQLWLTICCVLWWSQDFDNLSLSVFKRSRSAGGPHTLRIRPALAAISVPSTPPCSSAGLFQPLQCGEAMIRLSDSLHRPTFSQKEPAAIWFHPPALTRSEHFPRSCHPVLQLLYLPTSGPAADC